MHTILEHVKKAYSDAEIAVIKETSVAYGLYDFIAAIICERNGFNPKEIDEYISGTNRPKNFVGIKDIEKAILCSDVGITPSNDGNVIRLVFPELTEERRKELAKEVKKKAEDGKVAIRNIRREGNDSFKKLAKAEVSEDEIKQLEDELQKLTDKYVKDIDKLCEGKTAEIMTV